MEASVLHEMILAKVPDAAIELEGKDCDFSARVISPVFEGMSMVERQKKVLAAVTDVLATGELHAINVKAMTPDEFSKQLDAKGGLVTIDL